MMVMRQGTIIVSRVIVPRHLPMIHQLLFKHLAHHNHIVWDFDDNILANKSLLTRRLPVLLEIQQPDYCDQ